MTDQLKEIGESVEFWRGDARNDKAEKHREYLYDLVTAMLPVVEAAKEAEKALVHWPCNHVYGRIAHQTASEIRNALAALEAKGMR